MNAAKFAWKNANRLAAVVEVVRFVGVFGLWGVCTQMRAVEGFEFVMLTATKRARTMLAVV